MQAMGLPYQPISAEAFTEVQAQLAQVATSIGDKEAAAVISRGDKQDRRPDIFCVPFTAVPDLVAGRRVLVRGGMAYVGREQVRWGEGGCCAEGRKPSCAAGAGHLDASCQQHLDRTHLDWRAAGLQTCWAWV